MKCKLSRAEGGFTLLTRSISSRIITVLNLVTVPSLRVRFKAELRCNYWHKGTDKNQYLFCRVVASDRYYIGRTADNVVVGHSTRFGISVLIPWRSQHDGSELYIWHVKDLDCNLQQLWPSLQWMVIAVMQQTEMRSFKLYE